MLINRDVRPYLLLYILFIRTIHTFEWHIHGRATFFKRYAEDVYNDFNFVTKIICTAFFKRNLSKNVRGQLFMMKSRRQRNS